MLFVGLSIIAGLGLLISIVWVLHKHQQKENVETVDRTLPLPPLELRETDDDELSDPEQILGLARSDIAEPAPSAKPNASAAPHERTPDVIAPQDQWLEISKRQQADGQYSEALSTCWPSLPQMGAFKQSSLILRAQIRALKKAKQDSDAALEQLYSLAALANFFHAKDAQSKPLNPKACKQIDYNAFAELATPYQQLGYEHLSLLSKTDIKWMTQAWGEPAQHAQMRQLHTNEWENLQTSLKQL